MYDISWLDNGTTDKMINMFVPIIITLVIVFVIYVGIKKCKRNK